MLVVTRKLNQTVEIGPDISVTLVRVKNGEVRLGITAPKNVAIGRITKLLKMKVPKDPAVGIAWWDSRTASSLCKMINSLHDLGIEATREECWKRFGKGAYRLGWRPTAEQLARAKSILAGAGVGQ